MQALKYTGPFGFLLAIPLLYGIAPVLPLAIPAALLLLLLGAHQIALDNRKDSSPTAAPPLLPMLYIPLQLLLTAWALWEVSRSQAIPPGFFSLSLSAGVCAGVFGVLAAHEAIHSRGRVQRKVGTLMLTGIGYRHFRIAHLQGHHRHAATGRDTSSARAGESFYAFLLRALWAQIAESWRLEARRCQRQNLGPLRNRALQDSLVSAGLLVAIRLLLGWRAAAFFAVQSAIAILVLELFNYVAHYGLVRRDGEPLRDCHSWNSSGAENLLLFNMGRHSHHHRAPALTYGSLRQASAPELPGGYAGAILLALVPPLWRRVMNGRLERIDSDTDDYLAAANPVTAAT